MAWFVDLANVWYFLLGTIFLGLLAAGWLTRRAKYWACAVGVLGLIVLFWLLTRFIITDTKQIGLDLDAMAQAVVDRKADGLFPHIAKDFRFGALTREQLYENVSRSAQVHQVRNVFLWDKRVQVTGNVAEATFNFRADSAAGGTFAASGKAKFVREEGHWKMRELQVLRLGSTERQHIPGVD